jgi:aryl-alcohol dehydrogenase-like predicted oxidoreductase
VAEWRAVDDLDGRRWCALSGVPAAGPGVRACLSRRGLADPGSWFRGWLMAMEYAYLGRTGIEVSRLCLGTVNFGALGNGDHDECVRIIRAALDAGINVIDTADLYSYGESEEIVGRAIAGRREEVVLASKYFSAMPVNGNGRNRGGASRRWIMQAVEASLRRLGTDYLDIYQQHHADDRTGIDETLSALSDLVHQGKVRVIGTSNFPAEQIVEAQWTAERWGFERFRCHQAPYSLFRRGIERGVLPVCDRYGIGVMTWGPLNGGWLSGRFRAPEDLAGSTRFAKVTRRTNDLDPADEVNRRRFELVGRLHALAAEAGLSVAHLATAFAGEHPVVSSVIIGPRTMGQLEDSLAAAGLRLGDDLLDALDELAGPGEDLYSVLPLSARLPACLAASYRRRSLRGVSHEGL